MANETEDLPASGIVGRDLAPTTRMVDLTGFELHSGDETIRFRNQTRRALELPAASSIGDVFLARGLPGT